MHFANWELARPREPLERAKGTKYYCWPKKEKCKLTFFFFLFNTWFVSQTRPDRRGESSRETWLLRLPLFLLSSITVSPSFVAPTEEEQPFRRIHLPSSNRGRKRHFLLLSFAQIWVNDKLLPLRTRPRPPPRPPLENRLWVVYGLADRR